jgi:3-hydroxyacyl-CoA dehydrogenase
MGSLEVNDDWQPPQSWETRPICVLGGGVLGRRIAACFVGAGYHVRIRDPSQKSLDDGVAYVHDNIKTYTTMSGREAGSVEGLLSFEDAVKDCWLVFEAVPEVLHIKEDTFADLEKHAPKDCMFGSNSSSFMSGDLLGKVEDETKTRVLNTHYMMPPEVYNWSMMQYRLRC